MEKRKSFPLRLGKNIQEAVRDRAKLENRTQTDLIREAVKLYLLTPYNQKTAS
ncbi:MAG: hypothetical protein QNJ53_04105 [Pleurocapsa sp. MO_192.B19]|nr:hypothetical protein [Pleurocapsa sp. MO_192.B19]